MKEKIRLKSAICKNGHLQTSTLLQDEKYDKKYCTACGSLIIDCCPECQAFIFGGKGTITEDFYSSLGIKPPILKNSIKELPYYCHNCGKPYPWTQKFLDDYQALLDLNSEEIDENLNKIIFNATQNLLKDKFSKESIQILILKKAFAGLSEITKAVLVTSIANFGGEALKGVFNLK